MDNNIKQTTQTEKLQRRIKMLESSMETALLAIQETNNSLAVILGSAELLLDYSEQIDDECSKSLNIIINSVDRIQDILENSESRIESLLHSDQKLSAKKLSQKSARKLNVLIVDDDPLIRKLLDKVLEKGGHNVTSAVDGEQALELFKQNKIELVITDVFMPKIDGIQLVKNLMEENPWVPIIVISGADKKAMIKSQLRKDDIYFLRKPFKSRMLEEILEKI
ncbi:response regulator [candidate division KSB1 bacterium]|nr:response regulator [candidate division KSB1 bacterium]